MGFIKQVVTAFKPANLARGLDAARNPPSQAEIEASVATLSPEQRAAYDANMAEVEAGRAESRAAHAQAQAIEDATRVLRGPAGRYVHGAAMADFGTPDELERRMAEDGALNVVRELRAQRKGEFKEGLRQTFGIQEVKQIDDPDERARVAAAERAARDAARAPYLAPDPPAITISRLATRGDTQLAELMAHLQASGPDLLFGVYRVPDRISGPITPHSERGRVVEWDIVHTPPADGAPPAAAPLVATAFVAEDQWVARRMGERSVLDEDLALAYCLEAGIGPERCAGLARVSEFRTLMGGDEDDDLRSIVRGIVALHPEEDSGAFERMRAAAPLPLAPDVATAAGIHVEVLNWDAVARAVHLKIHHGPPVPSPFPYLPATPQELLRAYLEIVGLRPEDSYSAQATVDAPSRLIQGGLFTTNLGPKQPCADGKPRMRTHGCAQLVFVYRDRPQYAAGRERWTAYQRDVLQARLELGVSLRKELASAPEISELPSRVLRGVARAAEFIDRFDPDEWGRESVGPYRYCWPPVR